MSSPILTTVNALSTEVTLPQESVTSLATTVTLSDNDVNNNNSQPSENELFKDINLEGIFKNRQKSSKEKRAETYKKLQFLTEDSGGGRIASGKTHKNAECLKEGFLDLRDILLYDKNPKLLNSVNDFFINFSMETAEYTDPVTKDRQVIDLKNLEDSEVQKYVDVL